ncbi:MAG: hypothetical protein CMO37_06615 [Verrucomicrobiaceae bacterium]|nr:hypothetical protein [Verrucomicrobiaceae bacterium]
MIKTAATLKKLNTVNINIDEDNMTNEIRANKYIRRLPMRSTMTPKKGATTVPVNLSAAKIPRTRGDSVCPNIYQDKIRISINSAVERAKSPNHMKRNPRTFRESKALSKIFLTELLNLLHSY